MIEEDGTRRTRNGDVEIGVLQDDVRRLAAELERDLLQVIGCGLNDELADLRRAGERHLVDPRMRRQCRAGGFAETGDDVHHPVGKSRLLDQFAEPQRGERRLLGRLQNHGAAGGERRPEFPCRHQQGEVPRDDLAHHTNRLTQRVGVELGPRGIGHRNRDGVAFNLGGPSGHVMEEVRRQRHVSGAGNPKRLPIVPGLRVPPILPDVPG